MNSEIPVAVKLCVYFLNCSTWCRLQFLRSMEALPAESKSRPGVLCFHRWKSPLGAPHAKMTLKALQCIIYPGTYSGRSHGKPAASGKLLVKTVAFRRATSAERAWEILALVLRGQSADFRVLKDQNILVTKLTCHCNLMSKINIFDSKLLYSV
jgi:hypothetical protein